MGTYAQDFAKAVKGQKKAIKAAHKSQTKSLRAIHKEEVSIGKDYAKLRRMRR
jgi:hypothetical protein